MQLLDHPRGNYRFLTGIAPYSSAVIAQPGYALVRAQFDTLSPLTSSFERIAAHLDAVGRPKTALCSMELRIPEPLSFADFAAFNRGYVQTLDQWEIPVDDRNPIARTNVAPVAATATESGVTEPGIYAFTYTVPVDAPVAPSFIVAGAGDLDDQANLRPEAIVRPGDTSAEGMIAKARVVMDVMQERLDGLQMQWADVRAVNLYTAHALGPFFNQEVLPRIGRAALHGVHWYMSRPPIAGLDFEMDLRSVWQEIRLT